jgi:uncharacterized protein (DUF427 family)
MTNKPMKVPGPEHPIDITPTKGRVTVEVNGIRIADTRLRSPNPNRCVRDVSAEAVASARRGNSHLAPLLE